VEYCTDHKDQCKKIFDACREVSIAATRIERLEDDIHNVVTTIFGEGGEESLKSRIKGTEDAMSGLKELVLENREVVQTNIKGLFKVFVLTITAASAIIVIAFGVMWSEMKGINDTVDSIQRHQVRQNREPSQSPQLPFKTPTSTEGER
jgi:hypothetical protein